MRAHGPVLKFEKLALVSADDGAVIADYLAGCRKAIGEQNSKQVGSSI